MTLHEMTEAECLDTLTRTRLGRLACAHENQPYIVPIYFVYEAPYLFGFTTPGQKVDWMRSNPLVCVELDEIVSATQWTSVIMFGSYEELPGLQEGDDRFDWRGHAYEVLRKHAEWWEPGSASRTHHSPGQPWATVYYRVRIDRISGRRVAPGPGGADQVTAKAP